MADWTDERVALLKKLWRDEGRSASQCAEILGGITRNAAIGKVHRLGLARSGSSVWKNTRNARPRCNGRASPKPEKQKEKPMLESAPPTLPTLPKIAPPVKRMPMPAPVPEEFNGVVHLLDLKSHMCKWPVGYDGEHIFCGKPKLRIEGRRIPYCEYHYIKSVDKPPARLLRRRKPEVVAMGESVEVKA